jgi:ankyrin repeat protein
MLHLAVEEGHTDMCLYLIEKKKVEVNARDQYGWTPLHVRASQTLRDG